MQAENFSIVIVDDHVLVREGIRELLETNDDMHVVGEAGDSDHAVSVIGAVKPDIVLLDVEIPGGTVIETVERIKERSPSTQILILSMYDSPQLVQGLLDMGVRGYLLKSVTRHELVAAIRSAPADDGRIIVSVSRQSMGCGGAGQPQPLSAREHTILQLAAQALSNTQIASRLSLTEATVKRHLHNIYGKLGAVSRIDAVNKAKAASLLSAPELDG